MGHYLKANKSTRTPSTFITFDTETKRIPIEGKPGRYLLKFHLGYARSFRYESGRMTRRKDYCINNPFHFWDWINDHLSTHRPVWAIAHNVGFDITTLQLWEQIEQGMYSVQRYVSDNPPVIIGLLHDRGKLVIVDSMNWFRSSLATIGNDIGLEKIDVDFDTCSDRELFYHCKRDVEILEKRIFLLLEWLRENDLGVMQKTAPSQALQCYRHRFAPRITVKRERKQKDGSYATENIEVCLPLMHDRPEIAEIERSAYFGGEARCFWIGKVHDPAKLSTVDKIGKSDTPSREIFGPIYHVDVNSIYPYVMSLFPYPCRLLRQTSDISIGDLRLLIDGKDAIARVRLATADQAFPVRIDGKANYCVGTFDTTLCGQELVYALARGFVVKVHEALVYETAYLFDSYVKYFWGLRKKYKEEGNESADTLCKLMLNSLYGKFGAKAYKWEDRPDIPSKKPWGTWVDDELSEGEIKHYRSIGWNTQELQPDGEGKDTFVAISACVTANARQYMRSLRWFAGERQVIYQHTDSLHLTQRGYDNIRRKLSIPADELGGLKLEEIITEAEYRGVNNQTINGVERIAGVKRDTSFNADGVGMQTTFARIGSIVASKPPLGVIVEDRAIEKPDGQYNGYVDPLGNVYPLILGGK